jgi:hypothetical protein
MEKITNFWIRITDFRDETWSRKIPNAKQNLQPLGRHDTDMEVE